jgi:hypothetical protein
MSYYASFHNNKIKNIQPAPAGILIFLLYLVLFYLSAMKNVLPGIIMLSALVTVMVSCGDKKPETDLKGHYHGKNLLVENPYGPDGIGFCVVEVKVNGKITTDEINNQSFDVDFSALGLKEGDAVEVELIHKKGCEPVVTNPEDLH